MSKPPKINHEETLLKNLTAGFNKQYPADLQRKEEADHPKPEPMLVPMPAPKPDQKSTVDLNPPMRTQKKTSILDELNVPNKAEKDRLTITITKSLRARMDAVVYHVNKQSKKFDLGMLTELGVSRACTSIERGLSGDPTPDPEELLEEVREFFSEILRQPEQNKHLVSRVQDLNVRIKEAIS